MKKLPHLIFFGSGPVALASVKALHDAYEIDCVVTKTVPPHHKEAAPVETWARACGITVLLVSNQEELDTALPKLALDQEIGVVVDFGIIISPMIIDSFPLGIINSHFSLLPLLRGADPITFAILEGYETTGVSLMSIVKALDEGPLLAQCDVIIDSEDNTTTLTQKLVAASNKLLVETLPKYIAGGVKASPQSNTISATYTRKLHKADGIIDWQKPAKVLDREVRAFLGWPGSRAKLGDKEIIITEAHVCHAALAPGEFSIAGNKLIVGCGSNSLEITRLKVPGKAEMSAEGFIAGYC